MRNMSFALTTEQVRARTKWVTRRTGWWFLTPGTRVCAVKKAMGLKKGEKLERLCVIEIVDSRPEPLEAITQEDVVAEGFPAWSPEQFIGFLVDYYGIQRTKIFNRIEFKYVEAAQP